RRVPRDGCYPLSPTLDSIGTLAPDVASCALVDAVLAGEDAPVCEPLPIAGLRLGVPQTFVLEGLDPEVASAFARALSRLSEAGARVVDVPFPELAEVARIQRKGGFSVPEAYAQHRALIAAREAEFDPRVASRILRGRGLEVAEYLEVVKERGAFIAAGERRALEFDALLMPAVAIVPPPIAELEASDEAYFKANARALRNTNVVNLLDGCALSIPCHGPGQPPVGLMVAGTAMRDRVVLAAGLAVERALAR
ncbi:MAG TPA: amidase family protein, partial [Polyangiaceae bacterium]|nr:amidase family protein [Polyangiaceae bacterium]